MKIPTKFVPAFNNKQAQVLEHLIKNDSSARVRMRTHSILLSSRGLSIDEISIIYNVHRNSVSSWIDAWKQFGVDGLRDKPRSGVPPKLTEADKEIAEKLINEHPHSPKTVLAKFTEAVGKTISISSLKRIAKAAGLRWKRTKKSLKGKRDDKKFEKAKKEIDELKKQQQAGEIELWYFDESGFSLEPSVPYAWQPIGENIEIPSAKSKRLNVLGFFNTDNQIESFCFECSINTSVVVACFDEFSKTISNKTVVILDNASVHRSQEFQNKISEWQEKDLYIKYLPPYSPELNLIEILWRFIKYHWLPFSAYLSFKHLTASVEDILRNIGRKYQIAFA